jgi:hypothetical protein
MYTSWPWCAAVDRDLEAVVAKICNSSSLRRSRRLQRFLTYIVDQACSGRAESVKEYSIAVAVYDKAGVDMGQHVVPIGAAATPAVQEHESLGALTDATIEQLHPIARRKRSVTIVEDFQHRILLLTRPFKTGTRLVVAGIEAERLSDAAPHRLSAKPAPHPFRTYGSRPSGISPTTTSSNSPDTRSAVPKKAMDPVIPAKRPLPPVIGPET